jgi:hypothetical protein
LDLDNPDILLNSRECGFMASCSEEVAKLESKDRSDIRKEMKASVVAMLTYLQASLPWDVPLYEQLSYIDPLKRTSNEVPKFGVAVAKHLNRFTEEELLSIGVALNQYRSLPADQVPLFYTNKNRVDHFWNKIFCKLGEINGERSRELEVLVKLTCTLAHGNAFLERHGTDEESGRREE